MRRRETKLGHLRSRVFTIPAAVLVTVVLITVAVATSVVDPAGRWEQFYRRLWGRLVCRIVGARMRVIGAERLAPGANYVVASNHLSILDIPVLMAYLPIPFKILAKRELLKVPFIGWYLRRAGHLTVDRSSARSGIESMNESARLMRERHVSVLIFPEGTRSMTGAMQPFKDGAAYLAIQSGVPLVPVALAGTWDVLPAKSSYFMPGDVEVRIGQPIEVSGHSIKERAALTALLEQRVRELI